MEGSPSKKKHLKVMEKQKSSRNLVISNPLIQDIIAQSKGSMLSHSDEKSEIKLSFKNYHSDRDSLLSSKLEEVEDKNSSSILSSVLDSSSKEASSSIFSDPMMCNRLHRKSIDSIQLSSFSAKRLNKDLKRQRTL